MIKNFKTETMELVRELGAKVIAYKLTRYMDLFEENGDDQEFKGEGEISWDEIPQKLLKYDDGFGTQYWEGTILLSNKTWLTRGEYDGSEWWEHHKLPTVEEILNKEL